MAVPGWRARQLPVLCHHPHPQHGWCIQPHPACQSIQPSARGSASAVKFTKDRLLDFLCSSLDLRSLSLVISVLDDLGFIELSNSEVEVSGRGWAGRGPPAARSL